MIALKRNDTYQSDFWFLQSDPKDLACQALATIREYVQKYFDIYQWLLCLFVYLTPGYLSSFISMFYMPKFLFIWNNNLFVIL